MTSASNFSTGFLPVLFLFLSVHAVGGQEKGVVPWQFKGFVDTYHAFRTREPNDLMSSRARVRGEIGKSSGGSSLYVSFNITYNALLKERTGGGITGGVSRSPGGELGVSSRAAVCHLGSGRRSARYRLGFAHGYDRVSGTRL